jgi:hypothetical protein
MRASVSLNLCATALAGREHKGRMIFLFALIDSLCSRGCAPVCWWYIAQMMRTVMAVFGSCPIASLSLRGLRLKKAEFFAC